MYKVQFLYLDIQEEQPLLAVYIVHSTTSEDAVVTALTSFHYESPSDFKVYKETIECFLLDSNDCVRLQ